MSKRIISRRLFHGAAGGAAMPHQSAARAPPSAAIVAFSFATQTCSAPAITSKAAPGSSAFTRASVFFGQLTRSWSPTMTSRRPSAAKRRRPVHCCVVSGEICVAALKFLMNFSQ